MLALMYMFANITNTLLFHKYLSMLLAIHLGIGRAASRNPSILEIFNENPTSLLQVKRENKSIIELV